jgi:hypothetical protein
MNWIASEGEYTLLATTRSTATCYTLSMYLTGHAALGAVLATAVTANPAAAFGIGWLSHYLADFFPHGDEGIGEWTKRGNEIARLFAVLAVDGAVLLMLYGFLVARHGFSWPVALAMAGSVTPDVMWGLEKLLKRKLFWKHEAFHAANHNHFHIRLSILDGLVAQTIVGGGLWWMLLR